MQNRRTLVALAPSTLLYASSFAGEVLVAAHSAYGCLHRAQQL